MKAIYLNEEAMERARSKKDRDTEQYFWRFLWFVVGIVFSYAWLWAQSGGK